MKNILIALIVLLCGFVAYDKFTKSPVSSGGSYVYVYGRDSCSITRSMLNSLKQRAIPYQYYIIDDDEVADELHADMLRAGIKTNYYYLPVVNVNGKILIRPKPEEVQRLYAEAY